MATTPRRVPIKEGLLAGSLDRLSEVRLCATRCRSCGESTLGTNSNCPNCGGQKVEQVSLANEGTLYTYTVVRHRPPGNYRGPDEFEPFGIGLVEVDGVIRVMAPLKSKIEDLEIGMKVRFHSYPLRTNEAGDEVIAFAYTAGG